ncbi:MAG: amidohydrolase family protein [Planctomycetota bacterium]
MSRFKSLPRVAVAGALGLLGASHASGETTVYRVGKVLTMDAEDRVVNHAAVFIEDGRFVSIERWRDAEIPEDATVIDRRELWMAPGLVELHNHVLGSLFDLNDGVYLTNPGLRALDIVEPDSDIAKQAPAGGLTTALLIPGSATNMGGFGVVGKFRGSTPEDSAIRSPGSIKIAQAGNPEGYWYGVRRRFMNFNLRRTLTKAQDYANAYDAWEAGDGDKPDYDPVYHGFVGLFRGDYPATVHTQIYQVMMTTVSMLAEEFEMKVVLDHSTFDGYKIAPLVLEVGEDRIITMNGPRQMFVDYSQRKVMGNAARWWQGGIRKLGVNTDSPVIPQEELTVQAAVACWYGWTPYEALAGITRVGAEALMVDDRLGSIEPGKDADFALWTGDPIDPRSACLLTVIEGEVVYDASKGKRRF